MFASESASSNPRPKRPTRSGRGTGVGSCDADMLILDTQKRQSENDPLIPAETEFILTTNSALLHSPSSSSPNNPQTNILANERYFDRPEVLKSYREQLIIQTPEYVSLSEVATVGGRFRPRGVDEEFTDTSDAAYQKRHRKYETFEKRTRLREKEKLQHEQYKLKERLDQLRAMDGSAFMALPATSFSTPLSGVLTSTEDPDAAGALPGAQVNEGERRKQEMLNTGDTLEDRFRILLPPDRVRKPTASTTNPATPPLNNADIDEQIPEVMMEFIHNDDTLHDQDYSPDATSSSAKLKIKVPSRPSASATSTNNFKAKKKVLGHSKPTTNSPLARMVQHPPLTASTAGILALSPMAVQAAQRNHSPGPRIAVLQEEEEESEEYIPATSVSAPIRGRPRKRPRDEGPVENLPKKPRGRPRKFPLMESSSVPDIAGIVISPTQEISPTTPTTAAVAVAAPQEIQTAPAARLISRPNNHHMSHTPIPSSSTRALRAKTPKVEDATPGALMIAAQRAAHTEKTRKTIRNVMAFGMKVPPELDEAIEFELPFWLTDDTKMVVDSPVVQSNGTTHAQFAAPQEITSQEMKDVPQPAQAPPEVETAPQEIVSASQENVTAPQERVTMPRIVDTQIVQPIAAPTWRTIIPSGGDSVDVAMEDAAPLSSKDDISPKIVCM